MNANALVVSLSGSSNQGAPHASSTSASEHNNSFAQSLAAESTKHQASASKQAGQADNTNESNTAFVYSDDQPVHAEQPSSSADTEPLDEANSMVLATLFIATESAGIRAGLKQLAHDQSSNLNVLNREDKNTVLHLNGSKVAERGTHHALTAVHTAGLSSALNTADIADAPPINSDSFEAITTNSAFTAFGKSVASRLADPHGLASINNGKGTASTPATNAAKLNKLDTALNTDTLAHDALHSHNTALNDTSATLRESQLFTNHHSEPLPLMTAGLSTQNTAASSQVLTTGMQPATLALPISHPQWGHELGRHMLSFSQNAANGMHHAELRLDPPELGPLRISLSLSDNVAHAYIVSGHASVRSAIEQALPQLQQAFAQAGLSLGQADVSDQGLAQQFAQQNEAQAQQHSQSGPGSTNSNSPSTLVAGPSTSHRVVNPQALVDTFA